MFDLYTWLLLIALVATILGCVMLYMETTDYGSPPYKDVPTAMRSVEGGAGLAMAAPSLRRCPGIVES